MRTAPASETAGIPRALWRLLRGRQLRLVMLVPVPDYLVRNPALGPVPVMVVDGAVNQGREKDEGTDEADDSMAISRFEVSEEGQAFDRRGVLVRSWTLR
jgi:hypothetical protein